MSDDLQSKQEYTGGFAKHVVRDQVPLAVGEAVDRIDTLGMCCLIVFIHSHNSLLRTAMQLFWDFVCSSLNMCTVCTAHSHIEPANVQTSP